MKNGFTLAEVLITIAIIGVVAALTIPTLTTKISARQRITQLKTAYALIANAYQMAISEYGTFNEWNVNQTFVKTDENGKNILDSSGQELVAERFSQYLKVAKTNYEYNKLVSLSGEEKSVDEMDKVLILSNGTILAFGWMSPNEPVKGDLVVILPDKNVNNGILQEGVNKFYFNIMNENIVPAGGANDTSRDFKTHCDRTDASGQGYKQGRGCTAWVIYNNNMDYLYCDNLSWNGKKSCNN